MILNLADSILLGRLNKYIEKAYTMVNSVYKKPDWISIKIIILNPHSTENRLRAIVKNFLPTILTANSKSPPKVNSKSPIYRL